MYTGAGILGLTNAAKLAGLPEDPDAPHIGRIFMAKDGPVFLDDMASDEMRNAAQQAKMAGFQMATNPPEPQEGDDNLDKSTPQNAKAQKASPKNSGGGNSQNAAKGASSSTAQSRSAGDHPDDKTTSADYRNWRTRAIEDVKRGRLQRAFESDVIPDYVQTYISYELALCKTVDDVRELFQRVQEHQIEVVGS